MNTLINGFKNSSFEHIVPIAICLLIAVFLVGWFDTPGWKFHGFLRTAKIGVNWFALRIVAVAVLLLPTQVLRQRLHWDIFPSVILGGAISIALFAAFYYFVRYPDDKKLIETQKEQIKARREIIMARLERRQNL